MDAREGVYRSTRLRDEGRRHPHLVLNSPKFPLLQGSRIFRLFSNLGATCAV